ncbi:Uncharacterised protein [Mycobacterium tuberculosis]|nr:Uncharacterised protein [Mycobacterium tuberculosis]
MNHLAIYLATGPGERLFEGGSKEIGSLFLLGVVAVATYLFIKRAFTIFLGFAAFAMLVAVFVFSPDLITGLGEKGFKWIFEGWLS